MPPRSRKNGPGLARADTLPSATREANRYSERRGPRPEAEVRQEHAKVTLPKRRRGLSVCHQEPAPAVPEGEPEIRGACVTHRHGAPLGVLGGVEGILSEDVGRAEDASAAALLRQLLPPTANPHRKGGRVLLGRRQLGDADPGDIGEVSDVHVVVATAARRLTGPRVVELAARSKRSSVRPRGSMRMPGQWASSVTRPAASGLVMV